MYIPVTPCDGSQKEARRTPHDTFTFENITTVFIDLHMLLLFFYYFKTKKKKSQPHASLHSKTTKKHENNKQTCRNKCAKLACGPSNFKNTKPKCKYKNVLRYIRC